MRGATLALQELIALSMNGMAWRLRTVTAMLGSLHAFRSRHRQPLPTISGGTKAVPAPPPMPCLAHLYDSMASSSTTIMISHCTFSLIFLSA